ncbi:YbaB/EbfC family nucleoid-associated protein [bacterium]|nr:YbaB/EbfC family nucleoid-associated protein [bacterium]
MGLDMLKMMNQARKVQSEMKKKQKTLKKQSFEGSAGGGMVIATINGAMEFKDIKIDPSLVAQNDVKMLETMITSAIRDAFNQAQAAAQESLGGMMQGMDMGDLGKMLG